LAIFQYNKLEFDLVLYFGLINGPTVDVALVSFMQIRLKNLFLRLNIFAIIRQFIRPN